MPLRLRPRTPADLTWEWHWQHEVADAEWKRWDAPYFHVDDASVSYADFVAHAGPTTPDRLLIESDSEPIGAVSRWEEEPAGGGWWELGIVMYDPDHWGGGLGTRALNLWTERTFTETAAHVLTLTTWSGNERMLRAATRVGYSECARIPEARQWQGRRSVKLARLREPIPIERFCARAETCVSGGP